MTKHSGWDSNISATSRAGRSLLALALGIVLVASTACSSIDPVPAPEIDAIKNYRVGAPDELLVSILPEPVLERTVVVRPDGKISVDLIGDVEARGRTLEQIAADVQSRISKFKREASVTISLVNALSDTVTIFGQVRAPGTYALRHETRVAEVLGQQGGPTIFASAGKIRVIREAGGESSVTRVNLREIYNGNLTTNIQLTGGDIIYVPPNPIARVGFALQNLLFPFQQIFSAGVNVGAVAALF